MAVEFRRSTEFSLAELASVFTASSFDSRDAVMRASVQEADQLRQRTADMSEQKIANVAMYDVPMARTVAGARA